VDENYEFDLVSSGSSTTKQRRRTNKQRAIRPVESSQRASGDLYTRVNKQRQQQQPRRQTRAGSVDRQVVERSRYYDLSLQKQQRLTSSFGPSATQARSSQESADFYDTVYEGSPVECPRSASEQTLTKTAHQAQVTQTDQH